MKVRRPYLVMAILVALGIFLAAFFYSQSAFAAQTYYSPSADMYFPKHTGGVWDFLPEMIGGLIGGLIGLRLIIGGKR